LLFADNNNNINNNNNNLGIADSKEPVFFSFRDKA